MHTISIELDKGTVPVARPEGYKREDLISAIIPDSGGKNTLAFHVKVKGVKGKEKQYRLSVTERGTLKVLKVE